MKPCEASPDVHYCFITEAARKRAGDTWSSYGARSEDARLTVIPCRATRVRCCLLVGIANAVAREFARYRLLVPREVVRDRNMGRSEVRAMPAEGPMQADFFRHQADVWQGQGA